MKCFKSKDKFNQTIGCVNVLYNIRRLNFRLLWFQEENNNNISWEGWVKVHYRTFFAFISDEINVSNNIINVENKENY